jgi:hypothetical protein
LEANARTLKPDGIVHATMDIVEMGTSALKSMSVQLGMVDARRMPIVPIRLGHTIVHVTLVMLIKIQVHLLERLAATLALLVQPGLVSLRLAMRKPNVTFVVLPH